ncbi:MAG TPA: PEGA domain-containing protein [Pyrinomonadaceae bacterium]|nr:PEGA domain-containing protein [Pyrinomonadaceae bacterium]
MIGLVLTLSLTSALAGAKDAKVKRPKNTGTLTVKTTPVAMTVRIDGQVVGMSGVSTPAEFYLAPGTHQLEIEGPNGQRKVLPVEIRRNERNCVCLKVLEETTTRACPYNIRVDAPDRVLENDLITFTSQNLVTDGAIPINYSWTVTPSTAVITSGLGTPTITVDSRGLGGQPITATLDVTDDVYGATCQQNNQVVTNVDRQPELPQPVRCDIFESQSFDDDKARFDNCTIELQNNPDSQLYIILYQGTDRLSRTNTADKLSKRTLDYLVKTRGIDPRCIQIVKWGTRPRTTYEIYVVPPGAQPPVPQ